jgi:hypothetical protein
MDECRTFHIHCGNKVLKKYWTLGAKEVLFGSADLIRICWKLFGSYYILLRSYRHAIIKSAGFW